MPAQAPHPRVDAAAFGTPHPSAGVEIWYLTGHLRDEDGQAHTWTFSILRHHDEEDPAAGPGYCLCATHHGPAGLSYGTWITPTALRVLRQAISGDEAVDPRVRTALAEALEQGPLLPDQLLREPVTELAGTLDITVGDVAALRREEDGSFRLAFQEQARFDLVLTPVKPAVPQFAPSGRLPDDATGLTSLFLSSLDVRGTLLMEEGTPKRVEGRAWFEHDWGATYYRNQQTRGLSDHIWEWAGLQLDNGWEISATQARTSDPPTAPPRRPSPAPLPSPRMAASATTMCPGTRPGTGPQLPPSTPIRPQ
ncbi:lipocalin-like domain-containing protein [Streptomyces sp. NPDC050485]|uniref:lipocalin-like domain-containing protein n=1 Tax=Streptomyces sp. NPDC050485 TaxID=3365617 RepID=UPI0037A62B75